MILSAIVAKLKRRSQDDFKSRHFEAGLIVRSWPTADHPLLGSSRLKCRSAS